MKKIVYYVASSLDGFISGPEGDISRFIMQGKGVEKYQADLQNYKTIIMGRATYEVGYEYGLPPGQPAYPQMEHHIFSDNMKLDQLADTVHIEKIDINRVKEIQENADSDIYVCGGGQFAGWLLDNGMIDILKIKLNPIVLGEGVSLFGTSKTAVNGELIEQESFDDGMQILTYQIKK